MNENRQRLIMSLQIEIDNNNEQLEITNKKLIAASQRVRQLERALIREKERLWDLRKLLKALEGE